jgi:endonuclease/exonuclease/phosphatase family metal-dependent hydrolase
MDHMLRVASYNLHDFKDDADAAVRVIRLINPDVLCLQEVPRHLMSRRQVASFAVRCGMRWSGRHRGSGGATVMSSLRMNVADTRHVSLKVAWLQRERGYAVSNVRLPGHQAVGFVSIHLSLDAEERMAHAATVLDAVVGDRALVMAGDLNEGPTGLAWMAIAGRLGAVSRDAPTFPANNPRHRLDVIFASPELTVVPSAPVELGPGDLLAASDHLPIWVDLDLSQVALD